MSTNFNSGEDKPFPTVYKMKPTSVHPDGYADVDKNTIDPDYAYYYDAEGTLPILAKDWNDLTKNGYWEDINGNLTFNGAIVRPSENSSFFSKYFNSKLFLDVFGLGNPIWGLDRVNLIHNTLQRNPSALNNWDVAGNAMEFANIASAGLLNRLSPTQNIGLIIDAFLGDNIMNSWFGNSGIVSDKFLQEHPYWSMAINGVGDGLVYSGLPILKTQGQKIYDLGTLWDKYTTLGGRFGYYGNPVERIIGTVKRNLGLKTSPRHPELLRKIDKIPNSTEDGLLNFDSPKMDKYKTNHSNWTLDRPVINHPDTYTDWNGHHLYILDPNEFLRVVPKKAVKSIEPSDAFVHGASVLVKPNRVTIVSGDINVLKLARDMGMSTLSSPKLRRLFKSKLLPEYATEQLRLLQRRGFPTLEDFRLIEDLYGLNAGVIPLKDYLHNTLQDAILKMYKEISTNSLNQSPPTWTYPNQREIQLIPSGTYIDAMNRELELIHKAPYKNVFYDPTSFIEQDSGFSEF